MSLKQLRTSNGYSQEHLAQLSNLSLRTIQRIEKDNHGSKQSINAIANTFNMSYKEFLNNINNIDTKNLDPNSNTKRKSKIKRFILLNLILFIINMTTNPNYLWFLFPLLGWGIPLFYKLYIKKTVQKRIE